MKVKFAKSLLIIAIFAVKISVSLTQQQQVLYQQQQQQQQQNLQQQQQQDAQQQPQQQPQQQQPQPKFQTRIEQIYFPEDTGPLQLPKRTEFTNYNDTKENSLTQNERVISFAWKLFQESKLPNSVNNLVLSPLIIQYLLAILEVAADGETKSQLQKVIGAEDARNLQRLFSSPGRTAQLEVASGIFLDSKQKLNAQFTEYVRALGCEIETLNFSQYPDQSRNEINKWASRITHGTINELLNPAYDVQNVDAVITSAIYFHSTWKYRFNKTKHLENFYTYQDGIGTPTEFMEVKQNFVFEYIDLGHGVGGRYIEIPYEGNDYSMLVIVPNTNVTLNDFIHKLDISTLNGIIKGINEKYTKTLILQMPKFKIKSRFSLVNALLKMGVTDLFTLQSKLPHMTLSGSNRISDILQEATLNVDENGTVASAVTTSFLIPLSAVHVLDLTFTVNRPFLSIIIDRNNHIPLFVSKIYQPTL